MMKYRVGDKVVYRGKNYFENGEVVTVVAVDLEDYNCDYRLCGKRGEFWVHNDDLEPHPAADLTLSVEIPTQAMNDFADHCERAAAALERIKDILA